MEYFSAIKLILYWIGSWKLGSWIASLQIDRRPWITLKKFDSTGVREFDDDLELRFRRGKHVRYLIVDTLTGNGKLSADKKKAATARALGKSVYVFNFDRYKNFIQFKSCNASMPDRNYNFLTDTFEGPVNQAKDVYVQYFQTK
jgi:hypothetical protein